ncbi:MAG: caspase family protein [Parasphingorhabdus sp.]|uniref:caspase family protein n=1 Tax=Parasphingorhabdus sp. TaxID=2709688 RepID=UPI0032677869
MIRFLYFVATALLFSGTSVEAKKVALIIGNSEYLNTSSLENADNDASLVAAAAKKAGFEEVVVALDQSVDDFRLTLRRFREKADGADVAFVYYAGHGLEGQGDNWLVPVDAELNSSFDLPFETINLNRLMETVSGAQVRVVVLDACRNNPFANSWRAGSRAVTRGLAGIDVDDVLVIYAAAPGQTASDGDGVNSPFAVSLAARLPEPDLPLQLLGGTVRDDVLKTTGGKQRPFVSASITGTPIYLAPRTPVQPVSASSGVDTPGVDQTELEGITWRGAVATDSVSAFSTYLSLFPNGKNAALAAQKITALIASPPVLAKPSGTAPVGSGNAVKISNISIQNVKLTGFLGMPDDLFLRFNNGDRYPDAGNKNQKFKKGDNWVISETFELNDPVVFKVMEHDMIGGHDTIGTVSINATPGTYTQTMNGDRSEYIITYDVSTVE